MRRKLTEPNLELRRMLRRRQREGLPNALKEEVTMAMGPIIRDDNSSIVSHIGMNHGDRVVAIMIEGSIGGLRSPSNPRCWGHVSSVGHMAI